MNDTYLRITGRGVREIREKGSRFIAEAIPVTSSEEVNAEFEAIRKREFKATHHCYAFRLAPDGTVFGFSDAREPVGTAGPPILQRIEARGLVDTLVVVTRYFGGRKLGTGGLIRAYGDAAAEVLNACPVAEHVLRVPLRLRFDYPDTSPVLHVLSRFNAEIRDTRYAEGTELIVGVRRSQVDAFRDAYREALGGRAEAEMIRAP
ncbi:MAG TPA: YigZ family protein [Rhodothermales bacterium]|nr:YigZ family protein [Rhodothermales bacterium]